MRIVAGRFGGRVLKGPRSDAIRPTSDRLRETIFNILDHAYPDVLEGARVLDLFAGTGALGLEAFSRGAAHVLFVDEGAQARALLRENIESLGLGGLTRIFRRDARKLGRAPAGEKFQLAFLDPPYGRGLAGPALEALDVGGWLADGALCVVEEEVGAAIEWPQNFQNFERRAYAETQVVFAQWKNATPEAL